MLAAIGMEAFAGRARRELLATGERARKRTPDTRWDLTAQEAQIAELAREGYSNPEIGAQLFLSPRTVEWHLRKVFAKLNISSRKELEAALSTKAWEPQPVAHSVDRRPLSDRGLNAARSPREQHRRDDSGTAGDRAHHERAGEP
jgi:DNA-binding CsgD family transcriptional regulator